MKALQRINSVALLFGYLGFLATWILEAIYTFTRKSGVHTANIVTSRILRLVSPHFNLARQAPRIPPPLGLESPKTPRLETTLKCSVFENSQKFLNCIDYKMQGPVALRVLNKTLGFQTSFRVMLAASCQSKFEACMLILSMLHL